MNIELHLEVWNALKEHVIDIDLEDAADDFVKVLIEHGADANDILDYAIDDEIKGALLEYTEIEDYEEDELEFDDE